MKRIYKRRKKSNLFLLILLVISASIGYALISSNLNITGLAGIKKNTWDIHWNENSIVENPNSVTATTPATVTDSEKKTITFAAELSVPGDFYEFTADAKNYGTLDATIKELKVTFYAADGETKINELPEYLKYSFTYADGTELFREDKLEAGASKKYKFRLEFDKDTDVLPSEPVTIIPEIEVPIGQEEPDDPNKPYQIVFNPNGGSVSPTSKDVTRGETIGTMPTPVKGETPFLGWYNSTSPEATRVRENYIPSGNMIVYAKWAENSTTFDTGKAVSTKFKGLAGNDVSGENPYSIQDTNITAIRKSTTEPIDANKTAEHIVSVTGQEPIYAWFDNGTIYWWTAADYVYLNQDASSMFSGLRSATTIDLSFYTSKTTNMNTMFANTAATTLDFSNFDTSNVTDMSYMFASATTQSLDLNDFDTSNVTDMSYMFASSTSTTINTSSFNTSNVTNISCMFAGTKLTNINLSNFDILNVTSIGGLFSGSAAQTINISNWNFDKVTSIGGLFSGISNLTTVNLTNVNTSKVTNMSAMFGGGSHILNLDLSSFDTKQVTNMSSMFGGCTSLTTITVSDDFVVDQVSSSSSMFGGCTSIVGGKGTTYDPDHIDKAYAHYDKGTKNPGYFQKANLKHYTISFDANGGTVNPTSIEIEEEDPLGELPVPTKNNYSFAGWYEDTTYETQIKEDFVPTKNMELVAQWKPNHATVTYNANGGAYTNSQSVKDIAYDYTSINATRYSHTANINDQGVAGGTYSSNLDTNDIVTIPGAPQLTIEVWFSTESESWDWLAIYPKGVTPTSSNSTEATISGGKLAGHGSYYGADKPTDDDSTYHRIFTVNGDTAQFYFKSDSGSNYYGYYAIITASGSGYQESSDYEIPTKSDNRFIGWNTENDGSGETYQTEKEIIEQFGNEVNSITVYAMWQETCTITFNGNGGTIQGDTSRTIDKGQKIGTLPIATRTDYGFTGWYLADGITQINSEYIPTSSITVLAGWSEVEALFDTGQNVNAKLKELSGEGMETTYDYGTTNLTALEIKRSTTAPPQGVTKLDVSDPVNSSVPIWAWYDDENKIIYWWSEANEEFANPDSSYMFYNFQSVTNLEPTFNTSLVTTMQSMFESCKGIENIDLRHFKTQNVTNLREMFRGCNVLKTLDLSSFDTRNVTNMSGTLQTDSTTLIDLNLSGWDFSKYGPNELMKNMGGTTSLTNVANLTMDNVKFNPNMYGVFRYLNNVERISLTDADTSNVTTMGYVFYNLSKLKSINLSDFDTSNVTNMSNMFDGCRELKYIDLSSFNTKNVTTISNMFNNNQALETLDLSNFNTSNVTNMYHAFYGDSSLISLNLSGWDFSQYNSSYLMDNLIGNNFNNLETLVLDDTKFGTSMNYAFASSKKLKNISLIDIDTSAVTDMSYAFQDCETLETLDLSSFDTRNVTNTKYMFADMDEIVTIYVSDNFDVTQVSSSNSSYMFSNSINILGGNGTIYDANHIDKEYAHYDGGINNPGYFNKTTQYFIVKLNPNGGNVTPTKLKVVEGNVVGELPIPTKKNCAFTGWYIGNTDGIQVDENFEPTENVTLTAHWRQAEYVTVTFNPGNGATVNPTSKQVLEGTAIGELPTPIKENYNFDGWFTSMAPEGIAVDEQYLVQKTQTLYARWRNIYTVTFDPIDGVVDEHSRRIIEGNKIGELPVAVKAGNYKQTGWFTINNLKVGATYIPTKNEELDAGYDGVDPPNNFHDDDWDTITSVAQKGETCSVYNIGDTKEIDMGVYGVQTVRLANCSRPEVCDKNKFSQTACGTVIEFQDIITNHIWNPYGAYGDYGIGHGSTGGWNYSTMRSYLNGEIYNALPNDLKQNIIDTYTLSGSDRLDFHNSVGYIPGDQFAYQGIYKSYDKLYLPIFAELYGYSEKYANNPDYDPQWDGDYVIDSSRKITRQLDYYNNIGVRYLHRDTYSNVIKTYNGTASNWWTRTAWAGLFEIESNIHTIGNSGGIAAWQPSDRQQGVSPSFRLG